MSMYVKAQQQFYENFHSLIDFGLLLALLKQLSKNNTVFLPVNMDAQEFVFTDTELEIFPELI